MFASAAAVADANAVTIGDYVADVGSWVGAIRSKTGADCIWLAGHSEGGLVALASAGKVEGVCGLILLATAGRPLGTVIREQLRSNPANAPVLADAMGALDRLEAGQRVDVAGFHPALQQLFAPQVQGYLIDVLARDPAALAAATRLPMLILQGGKDIQVSLADAEALHAARPDAGYVVLPDANHVLKAVEGDDRAANVAAYADPSRPLASGVTEAIARFIASARKTDQVMTTKEKQQC
jgi:pimeloyl-ACP methyl ester carboxylesterase